MDIATTQIPATPIRSQRKPQIRVNKYQNGFWIIIFGKGGLLCANRTEGIAKIKETFPGDYDVIDVTNKPENPRVEKPQELWTTGPAGEKKVS